MPATHLEDRVIDEPLQSATHVADKLAAMPNVSTRSGTKGNAVATPDPPSFPVAIARILVGSLSRVHLIIHRAIGEPVPSGKPLVLHGPTEDDFTDPSDSPSCRIDALQELESTHFKRQGEWRI